MFFLFRAETLPFAYSLNEGATVNFGYTEYIVKQAMVVKTSNPVFPATHLPTGWFVHLLSDLITCKSVALGGEYFGF